MSRAVLALFLLLATPAAAQTVEQDELRYTQQMLTQLAGQAAHAAAIAEERQRQVDALKKKQSEIDAYWKDYVAGLSREPSVSEK